MGSKTKYFGCEDSPIVDDINVFTGQLLSQDKQNEAKTRKASNLIRNQGRPHLKELEFDEWIKNLMLHCPYTVEESEE